LSIPKGLTTHKREGKRIEGELAEKDARRQELEDLVQSKQSIFTELEDKNTELGMLVSFVCLICVDNGSPQPVMRD
jgi:hypothetical protein